MSHFPFIFARRAPLRALTLLILAALLAGVGLDRAVAKPNRHREATQRRIVPAPAPAPIATSTARSKRGEGNVYEGYTLVSGVRIMMPP